MTFVGSIVSADLIWRDSVESSAFLSNPGQRRQRASSMKDERVSLVPTTLLLATDGSEGATLAARAAVDLTRATGAKLDEALVKQERAFKKRAREFEKILGGSPAVKVIEGDAAAAILGVAGGDHAQGTLVAVGSRGFGMIGRRRLGSVSSRVLGSAGGSVVVYPHH